MIEALLYSTFAFKKMEDWSAKRSKKRSRIKTARLAGLPDEATASGPLSKTSLLAEDGCSLRNDDRPLLVFSEREQNESLTYTYSAQSYITNSITSGQVLNVVLVH